MNYANQLEVKIFVRKIVYRLANDNSFIKNVLFVSGGTVLAQSILFCLSPIITRLYSVEDFGIFQQYQSILGFLVIAGALRYDLAIVVPQRDLDAVALTIISLFFNFLIFILLIIACALVNYFKLHNELISGFKHFIWFIPFAFLGGTVYQTLSSFIIRKKAFSEFSYTKIFQAAGMASGQIGGGVSPFQPYGLFAGDLISKFLGIVTFFKYLFENSSTLISRVDIKRIRFNLMRYYKYPLISAPGALLNVAGFAIPTILIGNFFGLQVLGYYALVDRLFAAPGLLVGQSVSQVYISDAGRTAQTDPIKLKKLFLFLIRKLSFISFFPMMIAAYVAPDLVAWVFGSSWHEAGIYLRILMPMQFVAFIIGPLIPTLNLLQKQKWQLQWEFVRVLLTCAILYVMKINDFSARAAIGGYSVILGSFYIGHFFLSYLAINQRIALFTKFKNRENEY